MTETFVFMIMKSKVE